MKISESGSAAPDTRGTHLCMRRNAWLARAARSHTFYSRCPYGRFALHRLDLPGPPAAKPRSTAEILMPVLRFQLRIGGFAGFRAWLSCRWPVLRLVRVFGLGTGAGGLGGRVGAVTGSGLVRPRRLAGRRRPGQVHPGGLRCQPSGRCMVRWPRPWRAMRAATAISWPRMVAPRALAKKAPATAGGAGQVMADGGQGQPRSVRRHMTHGRWPAGRWSGPRRPAPRWRGHGAALRPGSSRTASR